MSVCIKEANDEELIEQMICNFKINPWPQQPDSAVKIPINAVEAVLGQ
ncbi:10008_t:CDS:2 [Entrophospora sp. SA101]|nr:10008_t:CDS:2 [Entrophospora sp. SA101]